MGKILAFRHNSTLADSEPSWGSIDKTALPRLAFADPGEEGKKSTWSYPHHWVQGGTKKDDQGIWTDGTLYLHKGGLNAAWAAAKGARSGDQASEAVKAHLQAHRKALGLDDQQDSLGAMALGRVRNRLMQLYRDNAGAGGRFEIKDQGQEEATIYLYDAIGDWYGIGAKEFALALAGITAPLIRLRINSPGGDVFDARAMQTLLRQHPAQVIAHIDGVAASPATFLVMGANEIEMSEGAHFMMHNSWVLTIGDKNDMNAMAGLLDKMDQAISHDYQKKSGQSRDEVQAWMDAETWMNAQEALDAGLVDRIYTGQTAENRWNLSAYDRVPEALTVQDHAAAQFNRTTIERRLALIEKTGR